jgi:hypothetical protein
VARTKKHERMQQARRDAETLQRFTGLIGKAEEGWGDRCSRFRDRKRAYDGLMDEEEKARWDTPIAPQYARHSIEVLVSNLLERNVGRVMPWGPEDVNTARCLEKVLEKHGELDEREAKDDKFVRETTIMGLGIQFVHYAYREAERDWTTWKADAAGHYQRVVEHARRPTIDRTSVENVSVFDFFGDPAAGLASDMGWAIHRSWVPHHKLKEFERIERSDGTVYGSYRNLDELANTNSDAAADRSKKETGRDHGDCVELCTLWTPTRQIAIGNRSVVIQDDAFPYNHGHLPFVIAHTIPDLYTLDGASIAEIIAPLQAAAWEVLNNLIKNTRIASLLLAKKRRDADVDDDALDLATGDVVEVGDMDDLDFWHPSSSVLDAGLQMLQVLKTTIQETSGANAYLAGGAAETIDQRTATGISIVQSMAQKLLQAWQRSLRRSFRRRGRMEIQLLQQYMTRSEKVRLEGEDGHDYFELRPWEIRNEYDFAYSTVDENLNDQQKKAEAGLLFDRIVAVAPLLQQQGLMVKLDRFVEDLLEAHGKVDTEGYVGAAPLMLPTPGANPGGAPGAPPAAGTPAGAAAGGAIQLPGVAA